MSLIDTLLAAWRRRYWRAADGALDRFASLKAFSVVTGASEGIGRAFAVACAARGDNLVLIARRPDALAAVAAQLAPASRGQIVVLPLDVTRGDAAEVIAARVREAGGYVDLLINNAGFGIGGAFAEQDAGRLDQLVALNCAAPTRLMRAFLPEMCARGAGGIINVSSLGGYGPGPWQAAYYASKAYVTGLSEAVAYETRGLGVRITAVTPGPVETGFHATMGSEGALYRLLIPAMSPERVVRSALNGYRWGRRVVVPGIVPPLLMLAVRLAPHPVALPLLGLLLRVPRT